MKGADARRALEMTRGESMSVRDVCGQSRTRRRRDASGNEPDADMPAAAFDASPIAAGARREARDGAVPYATSVPR